MANLTTGTEIDYAAKDYSSVVDALITFATVNYGTGTSANRLWTDFSTDSFSRTWLELLAYTSDLLFFYLDQTATENYLQTARNRGSIELIAKQFGFSLGSATSATGLASFTTTAAGTIPRGFKVQASNGEQFYTTVSTSVIGATTVNIPVIQGILTTDTLVATGLPSEEFLLKGPNVIKDLTNLNTSDISPIITVNGVNYTMVDTFIRNNGTDTPAITDSLGAIIGGGGRVYTLGVKTDGTPYLTFGDGIFGRKLMSGETISVTYRTGGGSAGNIGKNTLNTLLTPGGIVSSVINNVDFSGGADEQSIDQLKQLIPASLRTLDRAVSEQDYADILTSNFTEVFAAAAEQNTTQAGIDLNVYVVPQGVGIPQISDNPVLKNKLANYIDRRKMVTIQFQIQNAFGAEILIGLEVFITATTSRSTIDNSIRTAITNYFSLTTGANDGAGVGFAEQILLKDITNVLETIPGIERFEIKRLTYRPRVDARTIGLITDYNITPITVFPKITESEWVAVAIGPVEETAGEVLLLNVDLVNFTYNSLTGIITYNFPVDLDNVASGDLFRDGAGVDFTILSVNTANSTIGITPGLTVNTTVSTSNHGSIRNGNTTYEGYRVFRTTLAKASNLSIDSITDNNLDLSVIKSTGTAVSSRLLLDNVKVFVPGEYATGDYYLVDSASHIWQIVYNDANTIKTSISAIDDAAITSVASGEYKIVKNLTGQQIAFQGNIFNIQFNSENTLFSIGAQFSQIGTISDSFAISETQVNIGNLGQALDIVAYDAGTGVVRLNSSPNLQGVNANNLLIDSSGQIFNIIAVDNDPKPVVFYDQINASGIETLKGLGLGSQLAQGFEVLEDDTYAVVTFNLKREGNIIGNLVAKIVDDNGSGLPDLNSVIAASNSVNVSTISENSTKIVFSFNTPPTLVSSTPYHLVLSADAGYVGAEQTGVVAYDNTSLTAFSYSAISGEVQYAAAVNLSNVQPGHYFKDLAGDLYKILAVSDVDNKVTLDISLGVVDGTPLTSADGSVIINDRISMSIDNTTPTYAAGKFSRFDGALWSNDVDGPSPSGVDTDAIFSIEGTKSVTIQSNLTPVLGPGATTSTRYYDDQNEISVLMGISSGTPTSATNANVLGRGTVASVPNRPVDTFVFRSSRFSDDIVNLRMNEIPTIKDTDIDIQIIGGVQ